jgi:hypothetical protein
MRRLFLHPFAQTRLQSAMPHFERTGGKFIAGTDRHDARLLTGNRNENSNQFRMRKSNRHRGSNSMFATAPKGFLTHVQPETNDPFGGLQRFS